MQHALYHPQYGYYTGVSTKFGAAGDFVTAPELTPLFAYTVAHQCQPILQALPNATILEFGAGTGALCANLLKRLHQLGDLPDRYFILEVSAQLKQRQQQTIAALIPELADRIHWLSRWPEAPFSGIILANEVLDAMPVHRFLYNENTLQELFIGLDTSGALCEYVSKTSTRLQEYLSPFLPDLPQPYISEANLFLEGWFQQCSAILDKGVMLVLDYGFPRHEYYHPDRNQGTLICHYRHQAHSNFFQHLGEQDISAHVDFTHVAEAGDDAGFSIAGFTNQASFLLANGLLELIDDSASPTVQMKAQQAIKQLTLPHEMGELFKVMALTKGFDTPLKGFQLYDKRASL